MIEVANLAKEWLKNLAPVAIILFAILTSAGIISWLYKTKNAFQIIMKNPANVILTLIVMGALLYLYFKMIAPLFMVVTWMI